VGEDDEDTVLGTRLLPDPARALAPGRGRGAEQETNEILEFMTSLDTPEFMATDPTSLPSLHQQRTRPTTAMTAGSDNASNPHRAPRRQVDRAR
jgi:hypothetical protein